LGSEPSSDLFIDRPVRFDLDGGANPARSLLARAGELRSLLTDGRPLTAADLNAAASPAHRLDATDLFDALRSSLVVLRLLAVRLADALADALESLRSAADDVLGHARAGALIELEAVQDRLEAALVAAAGFAEPDALHFFTASEIAIAPDEFEAALGDLAASLSRRAARLNEAMAATAIEPGADGGIDDQIATLVLAMQAALDGAALAILPPLLRVSATEPLLEPPMPPPVALADWAAARVRVGRAVGLAAAFGDYQAFRFSDGATNDETGDPAADVRDEAVAPRTHLFGGVLARSLDQEQVVGVVADEWSEFRPSREQRTGLAIRYDAPQSEPPHCLLLCEPPNSDFGPWTDESTVGMVEHAIRWMTVRALPEATRRLPGPLLPFGNLVSHKSTSSGTVRRLPTRRFRRRVDGLSSIRPNAFFVVEAGSGPVGADAVGLHEINGFGAVSDEGELDDA
jgi:hypothetical protein